MTTPLPPRPMFASVQDYHDSLTDTGFWSPYVWSVLGRHGHAAAEVALGAFGTSATFLTGEVVVKLFGMTDSWELDYDTELAAHQLLVNHSEIPTPTLLAHGRLYDDPASWPYLVLERLPGRPWHDVALPRLEQRRLAHQLGDILRQVHDIPLPAGSAPGRLGRDWLAACGATCGERHREWGTLPPHLLEQLEDYIVPMAASPRFVHADLAIDHIFVTGDQAVELVGIIDWAGAEATDAYYELPILHFDAFRGGVDLLRAFLDGYGWEVNADFPRRAMSAALQHESDTLDNLLRVRDELDLEQFDSLDALATACWSLDD